MSDHAWFQEHVAAYLACGLDAQEAERLEAHTRECPACADALASARTLDGALAKLFAGARPDAALEDRAVAGLRTTTPRTQARNRAVKWAGAIAAVLLLGVIGAVAGSLTTGERLPGMAAKRAPVQDWIGRESVPSGGTTWQETLPNDDLGADSKIEAALPEIDRLGQKAVEEKVYAENGRGRNPDGAYTGDGRDRSSLTTYHTALPGANGVQVPGSAPAGDVSAVPSGRSGATKSRPTPEEVFEKVAGNKSSKDLYTGSGSVTSNGYLPSLQLFDPTAARPAPTAPALPVVPVSGPEPAPQPKAPGTEPKADPNPNPAPAPDPGRRIILRSGDIEFEIESFDAATATVTKLVLGLKGAFVSTVNSDKLPNGKVKGAITVRVPPEHLDLLVLDLRRELGKGGELKSVKLASQDVTKAFTDTESRLKGARTMEQRLLQIIKEGKGEIKQLLEAERELGVWRTKIEEFEGELRYYSNLAALSTLTITLTEKEIRAAAAVTERERVQAGVEVEDVDKAYQQLLAAVTEAKGRIAKSELKQLTAGQFNATFQFEVASESGGPVRDRLRMLGRVARLEIDRAVQTEGGTLPSDAKLKRGDTLFLVQLYNIANVAPRETATLQVAAPDVPAAYQALRDAVAKTTGRVLNAQLNEQDRQNISAQLDFEVRRADDAAARAALDAAGEVLSRQVARAAETDSVTDSKILYRVTLLSASRLRPRETATLAVEVADVDSAATVVSAQVSEAKGRQVDAKLDRDARGHATATFVFEVPLAALPGLVEKLKTAGNVRVSQSVRDPQATDGKYATARLHVTLTNVEAIVPEGDGLWVKVRRGLSISASVLLTSVTWVVFGLCVVLPWAVIGLVAYRLIRRFARPAVATPATATEAPTAPGASAG